MAAFAPLHSAEWLAFVSTPPQLSTGVKWNGKLHATGASLVFTGAGTGTANFMRLSPGKVRIYPDLSRLVCPQGTSTSTLDVGYAAYTNEAGTAVVAAGTTFTSAAAVGSGAIDQALTLPAIGYWDGNSQNGITITITFNTANSPASGEAFVLVVFQKAQ